MTHLIPSRRCLNAYAILMCCVLTACVGAPVQEMSNARQAIRAALDAGADRVAPEPLAQARVHMERAEASLQVRSYGAARRDAVAARSKAVEALTAVQTVSRPDSG